MKNIIFVLSVVLLVSCEHRVERWVCTCQQNEKVQAFVSSNIKSANNMSDEEMEDVIRELYKTGVKTNCATKIIITDSNFVPLEKLKDCEVIIDTF